MSKEKDLQNRLNTHLRKSVVFTYDGVEYRAFLDLTDKVVTELKVLSPFSYINEAYEFIPFAKNIEAKFKTIEKYLKDEGFFDY